MAEVRQSPGKGALFLLSLLLLLVLLLLLRPSFVCLMLLVYNTLTIETTAPWLAP